jgi:hypothetical protein
VVPSGCLGAARTRDARAEGYLRSQLDVAGLVLRALISEGVERLELKKA